MIGKRTLEREIVPPPVGGTIAMVAAAESTSAREHRSGGPATRGCHREKQE